MFSQPLPTASRPSGQAQDRAARMSAALAGQPVICRLGTLGTQRGRSAAPGVLGHGCCTKGQARDEAAHPVSRALTTPKTSEEDGRRCDSDSHHGTGVCAGEAHAGGGLVQAHFAVAAGGVRARVNVHTRPCTAVLCQLATNTTIADSASSRVRGWRRQVLASKGIIRARESGTGIDVAARRHELASLEI